MTDNDSPLRFSIENGRLYNDSDEHDIREVTHVQRLDGDGFDYLELWVSGQEVSAGHSVGKPIFTLTLTPEGPIRPPQWCIFAPPLTPTRDARRQR